MPTYDYECAACGETTEIFQSISEPPKRKCPHCGKPKLKRLLGGGGGFLFKGSGFYSTDYRSSEYQAKAKAETEGGKKPSGEGKPESSGTRSEKERGGKGKGKGTEAKAACH